MTFDFSPYEVLIAGEQFGKIRDAFRARGFNALSCDLEGDRTGIGPHFTGSWDDAIRAKVWPLIIFHPECTCMSVSGNWVYGEGKPRHHERVAAVEYTESRWGMVKAHSRHAALENPQGVLPSMARDMKGPWTWVQPYEHGDDASKKTGFLLHNLPEIVPGAGGPRVEPRWVCCGEALDMAAVGKYGCANCEGSKKPLPRWANQTDSGQNKLGPSADRARQRAQTYPGIARALARTWGNHVFGEHDHTVYLDSLI